MRYFETINPFALFNGSFRYTKDQQKRLNVDENGNKIAAVSHTPNRPVQKQNKIPVRTVTSTPSARTANRSPGHATRPFTRHPVDTRQKIKAALPLPTAAPSKSLPVTSSAKTSPAAAAEPSDAFDKAQRYLAVYHAAEKLAASKAVAARAAASQAAAATQHAADLAHEAEAEAVKVRFGPDLFVTCHTSHVTRDQAALSAGTPIFPNQQRIALAAAAAAAAAKKQASAARTLKWQTQTEAAEARHRAVMAQADAVPAPFSTNCTGFRF